MFCLVTGASGFLGRYVVEQLVARGDRVRVLIRRDYPELAALGVEVVLADLTDAKSTAAACKGVDAVYHVAGKAGIWGPWREYFSANVLGTAHILAGCQRHGVKRLVYTSSPSVTFDGRDQCGVDESASYPNEWLAYYPQTKALAEQAVLAANRKGGLLTCALRPHLIWGPRDRHLIPRLLDRARKGKLRQVGDGKNLVDITFVENAARAHLLAADALIPGSTAAGRAYFISQGTPVNCWAWINEVLASAGLPPVTKSVSAKAAYRLGAACETIFVLLPFLGEPPMTRFLAAQLCRSHYFDISAARRDFGYEPLISTADGMQQLKESW
jgi:nucleoside-diphosphate-sugar epimerase